MQAYRYVAGTVSSPRATTEPRLDQSPAGFADGPERDDRSGDHAHAGVILHRPARYQEPATHQRPGFAPERAVHHELPAGHAPREPPAQRLPPERRRCRALRCCRPTCRSPPRRPHRRRPRRSPRSARHRPSSRESSSPVKRRLAVRLAGHVEQVAEGDRAATGDDDRTPCRAPPRTSRSTSRPARPSSPPRCGEWRPEPGLEPAHVAPVHDLPQMEMVRAELAAVVARLMATIPSTAGGVDAEPHGARRSRPASMPLMTISSTEFTVSGSAVAVTARSVGQKASLVDAIMLLIRREPTLLPLRTTPPGNGRMTPGMTAPSPPRPLRPRRAPRRRCAAEDQEVAAADALHHAELLLHQELALHHRDPPEALAADHLARLKAVAEEPERRPHAEPVGRIRQAVEAGGRGAGEHRLPDPLDQPLRAGRPCSSS